MSGNSLLGLDGTCGTKAGRADCLNSGITLANPRFTVIVEKGFKT